jgi:hypothetical protein
MLSRDRFFIALSILFVTLMAATVVFQIASGYDNILFPGLGLVISIDWLFRGFLVLYFVSTLLAWYFRRSAKRHR